MPKHPGRLESHDLVERLLVRIRLRIEHLEGPAEVVLPRLLDILLALKDEEDVNRARVKSRDADRVAHIKNPEK